MAATAAKHHDPGLLTIAEIAKRYDLPESTARYYCKRFLEFLPHVGHGKRRRYRPEAMDVFAIILLEMKKRKDAAAVEAVLEDSVPRVEEITPPAAGRGERDSPPIGTDIDGSAFMATIERQNEALQGIASALTRLASAQSEVKTLKDQVARQQTALERLSNEVARIRSLQDDAESTHQQDLEQLRRHLGHLAGELRKVQGE
ncbi:MerR family transcriptional regulator [Oceanidesulfovibrio indonesiensis]|uniref:MerR family transcriptional regulator n=1 Tax=Oceanidesulfovibrio indonesiensis TaxID=54767 RepID=A0A7M3MFW1_9BACT|nr:MerR family transcriptional regulator [Oceanidesulfovibrio indonesiensis]TVM17998.1 MerR family transcriptional regulator [Oceanidesulfovibrio indonesiensis]